jgi:cell wall-associated NlpC family hydrolase
MTYNNNNASTSTATNVNTNNNVNTGTMTYNNNNVSASTATNNNNNVSTSTATNNNVNTGDMTNRNINTSTSTSNNVNQNVNQSTAINQNVQTGDMTNRNINTTEITQKIIQPPPTAVAPAMISGGNADLCSTGSSGSVQTQVFGVSGGGTIRDMNCERLKLSKTLYDMGMKVAAVATMCQDRRVFDAMIAAGTPCPYEGKIGEQARAQWDANPDRIPKVEEEKIDDTYKKVGLGALLGVLVHKLF